MSRGPLINVSIGHSSQSQRQHGDFYLQSLYTDELVRRTFTYSNLYLTLLFVALIFGSLSATQSRLKLQRSNPSMPHFLPASLQA